MAIPAQSPKQPRAIATRSFGHKHGFITRLMSPGDIGQLTKPFVFLDLFGSNGGSGPGFGMHPHSGIATLTYLMDGSISYRDTTGAVGTMDAGGIEWMKAGRGAWHSGGPLPGSRIRGFQLWFALPPEHELGPSLSMYFPRAELPRVGPATLLLGTYQDRQSPIDAPVAANYLFVTLKAGERWEYMPPTGHDVLWAALADGEVDADGTIHQGEIAVFEASEKSVVFRATRDSAFVIGSGAAHHHPLVLGHYSVHTSEAALAAGETEIARVGALLSAR